MKILIKPRKVVICRKGKKVPAHVIEISGTECVEKTSGCSVCEETYLGFESHCIKIFERLREDGYCVGLSNPEKGWNASKTIFNPCRWSDHYFYDLRQLLHEEIARMKNFIEPLGDCVPPKIIDDWLNDAEKAEEIEITI